MTVTLLSIWPVKWSQGLSPDDVRRELTKSIIFFFGMIYRSDLENWKESGLLSLASGRVRDDDNDAGRRRRRRRHIVTSISQKRL